MVGMSMGVSVSSSGVSGGSGNWKEGGLVHIPWVKSELSGER